MFFGVWKGSASGDQTDASPYQPPFVNHVDEIASSNLLDPCNPSASTAEIVNNALKLMESCSIQDFDTALGSGPSKIIVDPSLQNNCPKAACVLTQMINGSNGNELICGIVSGFEQETSVTLQFQSYGLNDNSVFGTTGPASADLLVLTINSDVCNNLPSIKWLETIQHELIHADIMRRLIEDYNWVPDPAIGENEALNLLIEKEYGEQAGSTEHSLMLNYYLDQMVENLIQSNSGLGSYDDFVGLVIEAFPIDLLHSAGYTDAIILEMRQISHSFIQQPGSINSFLSQCD